MYFASYGKEIMKNVLLWIVCFIPALLVELLCLLSNWFVAFFITTRMREDTVKRANRVITMPRDYLIKLFYWWQTHDNAVDEWWYGMYNVNHWFKAAREWTQRDYDNSWWIRYYCRVCWLYRNVAYGWLYAVFSRPKEDNPKVYTKGIEDKTFWYRLEVYPSSFHLEAQIPIGSRYASTNIGWKAHKLMPRLLYANRIPFFSFKKYKD